MKVKLDSDVQLKTDATFAVSMLDLMGGKKINISPGENDEEINYSRIQKGQFNADIPSVLSMLGSMQGDLNKTIKDVEITLNSLNNYLTDQKLNNDIRASIANLKDLTHKMNVLIDQNQSELSEITSNTVQITNDARELIHNNKESIQNSIKELQSVLKRSDSLMTKLNSFAEETTGRKNNLGKILYDDSLYTNLRTTLRNAKTLTGIIIDQLRGDGLKVDADVDLF